MISRKPNHITTPHQKTWAFRHVVLSPAFRAARAASFCSLCATELRFGHGGYITKWRSGLLITSTVSDR